MKTNSLFKIRYAITMYLEITLSAKQNPNYNCNIIMPKYGK